VGGPKELYGHKSLVNRVCAGLIQEKLTYECFLKFPTVCRNVFARIFTDEHHLSNVRFRLSVAFETFGELAMSRINFEDHNRLSQVISLKEETRPICGLTILVSHLPVIKKRESAIKFAERMEFPNPTSRMPGSTIAIFLGPLTLSDFQ
jgi:hypothetical protein